MKRVKALLLVLVFTITCVAFSACSNDPKSLNGEEVNRLEWLNAFEYVAYGVACQNESASFKSYGTYNRYEYISSDSEEKKLIKSFNYTMQVNKNVLYAELSLEEFTSEETDKDNEYLYVYNAGSETLAYSSSDKVKWGEETLSSSGVGEVAGVVDSLKNMSYKFNGETGMYESVSQHYADIKIKFHDKKIVYISANTGIVEAEFFLTDYDKTEVKQSKPTVEKNLEKAYNAVKDSTNSYTSVTLSEDGSYMEFTYCDGINDEDFETVNKALGLPNSTIVTAMRATTDLYKRETFKQDGITVTWVKRGENSTGGIYDVTYILE